MKDVTSAHRAEAAVGKRYLEEERVERMADESEEGQDRGVPFVSR